MNPEYGRRRHGMAAPTRKSQHRAAAIYAFVLMFWGLCGRMLASMSEIDPRADAPLVDWSELGVS